MDGIVIDGLTRRYGSVTAVDGLTLSIPAGERFALLGVNGAGKTTTVRMLCCLTRPDSGDALVCGKSVVHQSREVKALIGLSPQQTAVAPNLTAWLSGAWFDLDLVGGWFRSLAGALPFLHAVSLQRTALAGQAAWADLGWVLGYTAAALALAAAVFAKRMGKN